MKKTLLIVLIMLFALFPFYNFNGVFAEEGKKVKVITECNLYKETKLNYAEDNGVLLKLEFGDILEITGESIKGEDNDFYFYPVLIIKSDVEQEGYVIVNFVTDETSLEKKLDPNAKTLNLSQIYSTPKEEDKFRLEGKDVVLEKYVEIKIVDGYDKSKKFHQIMFEIDGTIYVGYIKTSDLLIEGFNATIILVVFIFVLVALIAFSIWKTTRKKRKRQTSSNDGVIERKW